MTRKPFWLIFGLLALAALACGLPARQDSNSGSGASEGERLYQSLGCAGCHSDSDRGPSLVGIYGREETLETGETVTVDEDYLRESILEPDARVVQGYRPIMPDFDSQLDEEALEALVEYIRSLE